MTPALPARSIGPELRGRIRRGLDFIALAGGVLATIVQIPGRAIGLTPHTVVPMIVTATIAICGLLGLRGRATWTPLAYVVLLFFANLIALATFGLLLGMGTVYILMIGLAFTFMSRIWRWVVVLSVAITPVIVGLLFELGALQQVPVFDSHDPNAWRRVFLIGVAGMIGIALLVASAVSHLHAARRAIETATRHELEVRLAREQVELEIARAHRAGLIVDLAAEVGDSIGAALRIVSSRAEALMQELDGEARACLAEVITASRTAHSTMTSLTLFSPATPGVDARSDAAQAARTLPQMLSRTIPQRIDLVLSIEDDASIPLSATDLLRILSNLVLNARDAIADAGSIDVHVRRGSGSIIIEVADDGSGMDEETRARLFEPFFTTKPIGRGTGLGLATAKILLERAGGAITVVSQPGRGTRFTITLPDVGDQCAAGSSLNDLTTRSPSGSSANAAPTTTYPTPSRPTTRIVV